MIVQQASKKYALSQSKLSCVGEIDTLNVTRGCGGGCVFCYARCLSGAPAPGTLLVYRGLDGQLRQELDSRHRRSPLPSFVVLSTASDAFLGGEEVLRVTRPCLELLLSRRIGVSLSTRGELPGDVIALLGRHAERVRVFIPLASMSAELTRRWEPGTALPQRRLFNVQRLLKVGITPLIRLDPVIPFINDQTDALKRLCSAVQSLGLRSLIASHLHLRPGLVEQLEREVPARDRKLVLGGFGPRLAASTARYRRLPPRQRYASLQRISSIAAESGLRVAACQCQNRDLRGTRCPVAPPRLDSPVGQQEKLFEEQGPETK